MPGTGDSSSISRRAIVDPNDDSVDSPPSAFGTENETKQVPRSPKSCQHTNTTSTCNAARPRDRSVDPPSDISNYRYNSSYVLPSQSSVPQSYRPWSDPTNHHRQVSNAHNSSSTATEAASLDIARSSSDRKEEEHHPTEEFTISKGWTGTAETKVQVQNAEVPQEQPQEGEECEDPEDYLYDDDGSATSYMNEEEEEALQRLLSQDNPDFPATTLLLSNDLSNLTEETLEVIQTNPQLSAFFLDRVQFRVHPQEGDPQELNNGEDNDQDDAPDLSSESSHTTAMNVLESLEESLAVNTSLVQVGLVACHPKVMESVLWGVSCIPSNLNHLTLEMWNVHDNRRTKYLIWEGLVELLKNTTTLESLYIGNCHGDEEDVTAMNWSLLAQGLAQNTSLHSLSMETLSWTQEATSLLSNALSQHPHLAQADFEFPNDHSTLVTIRRNANPVAAAAAEGAVLEDATNHNHRIRPVVSADDMSSSSVREDEKPV